MSKRFKHTPGPWELRFDDNGKLELGGSTQQSTGVYSSAGFGCVADVIYKKTYILGDSKKLQQDTFEANAKLIAAAPELLEALQRLLRGRRKGDTERHYWIEVDIEDDFFAEDAIKKATE